MNEEMLSYFTKVKPPYNISYANQQVALETLNNEKEYQKNLRAILIEKDKLISRLQEVKIIRKIYSSDANFLLVEVDDADALYSKFVEQKIIIRNRSAVVNNCVRITVGSANENEKLLIALINIGND